MSLLYSDYGFQMSLPTITFINNAYESYKLKAPDGHSIELKTGDIYPTTETGRFFLSRDGTDVVVGGFGGAKAGYVEISDASVSQYQLLFDTTFHSF
jgi:hypothetical protein